MSKAIRADYAQKFLFPPLLGRLDPGGSPRPVSAGVRRVVGSEELGFSGRRIPGGASPLWSGSTAEGVVVRLFCEVAQQSAAGVGVPGKCGLDLVNGKARTGSQHTVAFLAGPQESLKKGVWTIGRSGARGRAGGDGVAGGGWDKDSGGGLNQEWVASKESRA